MAHLLREVRHYRGYIHLKTIPDASDDLTERAGRSADRLSINIELPTPTAMAELAPEKNAVGIRRSMARIKFKLDDAHEKCKQAKKVMSVAGLKPARAKAPRFSPAGHSAQ